jgi:hypothetical protein
MNGRMIALPERRARGVRRERKSALLRLLSTQERPCMFSRRFSQFDPNRTCRGRGRIDLIDPGYVKTLEALTRAQ